MMAASAPMASLASWKQNSEGDMYQVYKPRASPKPRPVSSSPRYVRTWSQEEEAYLLEARKARVPYKDIASRLNKTDLACRLHYHQMVVARKNSIPEDSAAATASEQYNTSLLLQQQQQQQQYHNRSDSLPPIGAAMSSQVLLPAPKMPEISRTGSGATTLDPNHRRSLSQPQTPGRRQQATPSPPLGGISKPFPPASNGRRNVMNCSVDVGRVQELYRDFAPSFWSNIAAAYSQDKSVSPSDVEHAFFQGHGLGLTPPEPISPQSSVGTSPTISWPSAASTVSSAHSHMAVDDRSYSQSSDPLSAGDNKSKCSVNSLLNN